ncbi:MAG TPA: peptide-N4-asparagine amidase [Ktedonobacteraceae bacterium]|nr:peptide-N4-asparagine amidase [Ktedonobacteraceae bacterium]
MKTSTFFHRLALIFVPILLLGAILSGSTQVAFGQGRSGGSRPHHVAPIVNASRTGSANPVAFGEPVAIPSTRPTIVHILTNQPFGNAPSPAQSTVTLPAGHWQKAILTITGSQKGRQFDRLLLIWAANTPIFTGVTPEPTQSGIAWTVQKDVTAYLPLLTGSQTFTTLINNYVTSVYTGIPVISLSLSLYPRNDHDRASAATAWNQNQADSIVALTSSPTMATVHPNNTFTTTLKLSHTITGAYLDLYSIAQINDEFWWASNPAFRELEVSIDGKPAGVAWPFPFVYTGGVNPYLWRPISAINTLNMPSYRLDLTPFAGLLGGQHTITINVLNNQDYWLLSGSLFLKEDRGHATSGSLTQDTLHFPTLAQTTTTPLLSDTSTSGNSQIDTTATQQYELAGKIQTAHGTFTATVKSSLNFSNDQVYTNPDNWQLAHGFQEVTTDESLLGPHASKSTRHSDETYTIDTGGGYIQSAKSQSAFLLPSNLSQTLNIVHEASSPGMQDYQSTLNLNLESFANLQSGDSSVNVPTVALGSTTGSGNFETNNGLFYHLILAARAGSITEDNLQANFKSN